MALSFLPNKINLKERGNYGIRVARPGFDANNCAQNQLLFNSGWPILQIVDVIDMRDELAEYKYTLITEKTITNQATGEVTYEKTTEEVPSVPSGYDGYNVEEPNSFDLRRAIYVNKKYVKKKANFPKTHYYYPSSVVVVGDIRTVTTKTCEYEAIIPTQEHYLGFTPFFMASEWISNIKGYVVLFSVDIRKDVDYPYTEGDLPFLSGTKDYGIKSSSKFGNRVPGLCTNMFSKLVQCVKTEETIRGQREDEYGYTDTRVIWNPEYTDTASEVPDGIFEEYEIYSFVKAPIDGDDGGTYFQLSYTVYMPKDVSAGVRDAWAVTTTSFQSAYSDENSLVVLRRPMVSPEYEEMTI